MERTKLGFIFALVGIMVVSILWYYFPREASGINADNLVDNHEFIFSKEEKEAIDKLTDNMSGDDIAKAACKNNDAVALWIQGMILLTGGGGWAIDTESANHFFARSASLGFAPALNQLSSMYNLDLQNPFLGLVYLNLTISAGHVELMGIYDKLRNKLIGSMGLLLANEIEKVAVYKKILIFKNEDLLNKNTGDLNVFHINNIVKDDVLFDREHWQSIWDGSVDTGNLEEWVNSNENFSRKIERLAAKADRDLKRLALYEHI